MYDCIVVGSGPAGSTAARALARNGARVIVLEKERLPRYKTCGGAVSGLAARWLDVPWRSVSERRLSRIEVRYRFGPPLFSDSPTPFADFVMRDRFDHLLATEAVRAGAELIDACAVDDVRVLDDRVEVLTAHGAFTAAVVIGADGAHSVVAKATGLGRPLLGAALEAEVDVDPDGVVSFGDRVIISYGDPEWGYGWVFPKARHLSIGVGTLRPSRPRLPRRLDGFLRQLGLASAARRVTGHPIPLPTPDQRLWSHRVILAGDAAGLADPLSGEGIAHAIRSGQFAAKAVARALTTGDFTFAQYEADVMTHILGPLHWAMRVAGLFYRWPGVFFTLFERRPTLLSCYFDVVQGKTTYEELVQRLREDLSLTGLVRKLRGSVSL